MYFLVKIEPPCRQNFPIPPEFKNPAESLSLYLPAQQRGRGFPIARLAILISLWTGLVRDLAMGPDKGKETGERPCSWNTLDALKAGDVVVGDRCFGSYFLLAELSRRGVDGAFRKHQRGSATSAAGGTWGGRPRGGMARAGGPD